MNDDKKDEKKVVRDPGTYRAMSVPFESADEANAAIQAFFADLREIRTKHRMRDIHVVGITCVKYADGNEGDAMWSLQIGDSSKAESMLAYALGREQAEHREHIAKLLAGKKK